MEPAATTKHLRDQLAALQRRLVMYRRWRARAEEGSGLCWPDAKFVAAAENKEAALIKHIALRERGQA